MFSYDFQTVYLKDLKISIPGISIIRLAHQRHSQKSDRISEHLHDHSQILLYLSGRGVQKIGRLRVEAHRGTLFYFPQKVKHGFLKTQKIPPLSLVIDFHEHKAISKDAIKKTIPISHLGEIEQSINRLVMNSDIRKENSPHTAGLILELFGLLYENLENSKNHNQKIYPFTAKIRRLLANREDVVRFPREIAAILEEDLSSINRKLRNELGINLSGLIDERRLEMCQKKLQTSSIGIGDVGWKCGFQDPNYFARWFRKKTGQSPRQWRTIQKLKQY